MNQNKINKQLAYVLQNHELDLAIAAKRAKEEIQKEGKKRVGKAKIENAIINAGKENIDNIINDVSFKREDEAEAREYITAIVVAKVSEIYKTNAFDKLAESKISNIMPAIENGVIQKSESYAKYESMRPAAVEEWNKEHELDLQYVPLAYRDLTVKGDVIEVSFVDIAHEKKLLCENFLNLKKYVHRIGRRKGDDRTSPYMIVHLKCKVGELQDMIVIAKLVEQMAVNLGYTNILEYQMEFLSASPDDIINRQ